MMEIATAPRRTPRRAIRLPSSPKRAHTRTQLREFARAHTHARTRDGSAGPEASSRVMLTDASLAGVDLTRSHTRTHTCTHMHTCTYAHTCTHARACTRARMHTRALTHTHTHMRAHTHTHAHTHTQVWPLAVAEALHVARRAVADNSAVEL